MTDEYTCDDCGTTFTSGRALGGHRKTHRFHKLAKPLCFTDDEEWEYSVAKVRVENPGVPMTPSFALAEACAVCPLEYMQEMQARGRCRPPARAVPQRDLTLGEEDEL